MITENESSIITSAVNAHGILFKKAVRQQLEQIQGVRIIGEEYPVKFQDGAQLDLLVQYKSKNQVYLTIIECKRAYATFKKWIFFECNEGLFAKHSQYMSVPLLLFFVVSHHAPIS